MQLAITSPGSTNRFATLKNLPNHPEISSRGGLLPFLQYYSHFTYVQLLPSGQPRPSLPITASSCHSKKDSITAWVEVKTAAAPRGQATRGIPTAVIGRERHAPRQPSSAFAANWWWPITPPIEPRIQQAAGDGRGQAGREARGQWNRMLVEMAELLRPSEQ